MNISENTRCTHNLHKPKDINHPKTIWKWKRTPITYKVCTNLQFVEVGSIVPTHPFGKTHTEAINLFYSVQKTQFGKNPDHQHNLTIKKHLKLAKQ